MNLESYPKEVIIKGGESLTLRPMVRKDGETVRMFFAELCEEEKLYVRDEDICPEMAAPWPMDIDYDTVLPILAISGDQIVGVATLHRNYSSWMMHLGTIRITVSPDFRGKGLGRILAGELFRNSLQTGLDKIITEIVKDQVDVSLFYNRLGFLTEASLSGHYLDDNGVKHDVLIMSNNLKQLWKVWVEYYEKAGGIKQVQAR